VARNDTVQSGARLLALNFRLAELNQEMEQTQLRVRKLEAQLEDARLASMMGEDAGNPAELRPELERSRDQLASQQEFIQQVKHHQWTARVAYSVARINERLESRRAESAGQVGDADAP
jgi:predicted  nucleic acid-binding Zn-ribbon protein